MRARRALAALACFSLLLSWPAPGAPGPRVAAQVAVARPNVLLIVTDDQRVGTMQRMPATKRWFRRGGTRFTNAFATTPLCCPSRASIMTGRYSHNHGVRTNDDAPILDHRTTLQAYLGSAGYRTVVLGKLFNRWVLDPPYFDAWRTFDGVAAYRNARFNIDGVRTVVPGYSTDYFAEEAARAIRSFEVEEDRPWFLYVAPYAPHSPYRPANRHRKADVGRWKGTPATLESDRTDKPPWVQAKGARKRKASRIRRDQLRTLLAVDDMVDRVFRAMRNTGELRDTLAIYLSDHGLLWGEHGLLQKQSPYKPSVRIPLFVRWPGQVPGRVADPRLAATVDVAPTVLQAAGVIPATDAPIDGRSLLAPSSRDRLLLEFTRRVTKSVPTWAALWTEMAQYVEYYDDATGEVAYREYYDLVNDPWQLVNLLGDADPSNDPPPDELAQLTTQLSRDRGCRGVEGKEACP